MDLHDLEDMELVKLFNEGKEWYFEVIYQRYYNGLYGYAIKSTRSKEDAEEITNNTLLLAFRNLHSFRGEARLSTWLFSILKNQICNYFRMIRRNGLEITQSLEVINRDDDSSFAIAAADWNLPENQIIQRENTELIIVAVNKLPDNMKKTAHLYLLDKLPLETIAKRLNCPTGTIRSRTFRIKKHLRKTLDLTE